MVQPPSSELPEPLIGADELAQLLRATGPEKSPVHVLDVRWRLDAPEQRPAYLDGHIPHAVYVDLERELAERSDPRAGRHPLPSPARLQAAARRWGLRTGETVVVYDDLHSVAAARAWWLLDRAGVDVRVFDGGLRAWMAAGYGLHTGDVQPRPGDVQLDPREDGCLDLGDVETWPARGILLDVRSADRYRGDDEVLDPIAGHIPGALNLPTAVHTDAGRFRTPDQIAAAFAGVGARFDTPLAAYCGSGVAAMHTVLAGAIAGLDVALFCGGWSQWSRTRGLPVSMGPTPYGGPAPGDYYVV